MVPILAPICWKSTEHSYSLALFGSTKCLFSPGHALNTTEDPSRQAVNLNAVLTTSPLSSLPIMTSFKSAFALSKDEVKNATPPGTTTLVGTSSQIYILSCVLT